MAGELMRFRATGSWLVAEGFYSLWTIDLSRKHDGLSRQIRNACQRGRCRHRRPRDLMRPRR